MEEASDVYGKYIKYLTLLGEENKPRPDDRSPGLIEERLSERLAWFDQGDVMVEVGVASFYTGGLLAFCHPSVTVIGIDNFTEGMVDCNRHLINLQVEMLANLQFIKGNSVEVAETFKDGSIGLCFIDANHSYDSVLADIKVWRGKIKSGGWLSFHDAQWPTVRMAIDNSLCSSDFSFDCREDVPNGFEIWQKREK